MSLIKRYILKLIRTIFGMQRSIKIIEYIKGLYRYPKKMIGRNLPYNLNNNTDILVFAAHPDDEVLGLSAILYRHKIDQDEVTIVYVTDGSARHGESWRLKREFSQSVSKIRYRESVEAFSLLNISQEDIFCLGFPDAGIHRYLKDMATDVHLLIQKLNPQRIYVHCIEGGHDDHDLVSFVVKSVCNKLKFPSVFEWAEYSPLYPLGTEDMGFGPSLLSSEEFIINISDQERSLKRKMLACHVSQNVEQYYMQGEAIRQASLFNLEEELFEYPRFTSKELRPLIKRFSKYIEKTSFVTHLSNAEKNNY